MNRLFFVLGCVLLSLLIPHAALSQSAAERRRLNELDAICYKARQEKIFEVQQQKIEECVKAATCAQAGSQIAGRLRTVLGQLWLGNA